MTTVGTPGGGLVGGTDGFPNDLTLNRSSILDNGKAGIAAAITVLEQACQFFCGRRRLSPPICRFSRLSGDGDGSITIYTLGQYFFPPYCTTAVVTLVAGSVKGNTTVEWRIDGGSWNTTLPIAPRKEDELPEINDPQEIQFPITVGDGDQNDYVAREVEIRLTPPNVDGGAHYLFHAGMEFLPDDSITIA